MDSPESIILFDGERIFKKSAAALTIARHLGGFFKLLYAGIIVPRFLRDGAYDLIAKNRYKWFGKKEECPVPTPELRDRFLD
jgi:predicted DCC family thiol-disulfide oxidoreductase YuxK